MSANALKQGYLLAVFFGASIPLAACAPGVGLSVAGNRVTHVERDGLPYGCRLVADVPVGVAPDASRAADEEQFAVLLRNKAGELGATHVVTDHSERRGTEGQVRWVGRGRAYRCGSPPGPSESAPGSAGSEASEPGGGAGAGEPGDGDVVDDLFEETL